MYITLKWIPMHPCFGAWIIFSGNCGRANWENWRVASSIDNLKILHLLNFLNIRKINDGVLDGPQRIFFTYLGVYAYPVYLEGEWDSILKTHSWQIKNYFRGRNLMLYKEL